jgi:FkbM family methyltransferase
MKVSYAQNFEDIMLLRALRHVEPGFYVDVGAAWPDHDSVTKLFSDRGWRGINIEPNPTLFELLVADRPRDVNLSCAAGAAPGHFPLSIVPETGLSTLTPSLADAYRGEGRDVAELQVEVQRLETILEAHVPEGQQIHFLKIDVEGFESSVIEGNNWAIRKPWIVLVEATKPSSQEPSTPWEPYLIEQGYQFVYFDGLNRFYVATEHEHLADAFSSPPNIFDGFITAAHLAAESRASKLEIQLIESDHQSAVLASDLDRSRAEAAWLQNERDRAERLNDEVRFLQSETALVRQELALSHARLEASHHSHLATQREAGYLQATVNDRQLALEQQLARGAELQRRIHELEGHVQHLERHSAELEQLVHHLNGFRDYNVELLQHVENLERHIANMYASTSWRAARPIRLVGLIFRNPRVLVRRLGHQASDEAPDAMGITALGPPAPIELPAPAVAIPRSSHNGIEESPSRAIAQSVVRWTSPDRP